MIYEISFLWETYTAAGIEGSLEERTSLDLPLGGCDALLANWKLAHFSHVDPALTKPDFFTVFQIGIVGVMPRVLSHAIMSDKFNEAGELLPIKFGDEDACLFHPLGDLDGLDKKRSRFWRTRNGHIICDTPVFRSSFHTQRWFFRIPGSGVLYTTSAFVDYYQKQGFTGLEFHPQRISET